MQRRTSGPRPRIVGTYDYRDENGTLLFQVVRMEPKSFRQRRPDGNGGWHWNLNGTPRVLYRLPELGQSGEGVYVVEGEKDADRLAGQGLTTTTCPGGAGKWRDEYSDALEGRHVAIIPDADEAGRKHAEAVAQSLHGKAASVRVLELPGLPDKGDASDWLDAGHSVDELRKHARECPEWRPATVDGEAKDIVPLSLTPTWPEPPNEAAFYGLAGDIVRTIEPHSEADPVALLAQVLVAFGNMIARKAHFVAEADRHYPNLFVVLVGRTSKGRKGSSWSRVRGFCEATDPEWTSDCIVSGLSSGEGLLWHVRDAIEKQQPIRKNGRVDGYETVIDDPGVEDKRLLVFQGEFSTVLRVMGREGSTLSPVIREAWDTGNLRSLTKNSPARATGAHISIVGHIVAEELRRYLTATEAGNGFGNRFLWVCVERSKALPDGGSLVPGDLDALEKRFSEAVVFAREAGELRRDETARAMWHEVYADLSEGRPGIVGALTSRAEAQVMRLASIYALMDRSSAVRAAHLLAALALWEYVEASVRYIFGDSIGDPVADEILSALRRSPDGFTRTQIRDLFKRHKTAERIGRALGLLLEHGRARCVMDPTGGRSVERWHAVARGGATEAT